MIRLRLIINTVRYLKLKQLYFQIFYRVRKPRLDTSLSVSIRGTIKNWPDYSYLDAPTSDGIEYTFLGETATLADNWNSPIFSKLWLYNLHYQDVLNVKGAAVRGALNRTLVDKWIAGNPPMTGNGWEPYCLSLRIVNWTKFFSRMEAHALKAEWLDSLALQVTALEQQLEFHIMANHLFANAKALVFAGVFFGDAQGDQWLKKGLELLDAEIREQFLADGAHYERSPMYQATLLWDIADLITLQQKSTLPELSEYVYLWEEVLVKGINWLRQLVHPDGEIAFFNDATFAIAPRLNEIESYAKYLNINLPNVRIAADIVASVLQPSGFARVAWPSSHLLVVNVAPVGPDYQPGHAHADTLSCELSLFSQRVLVNSGISQYGEGVERHRQRSTAAHNTVEVDGKNSSEVWAGFRVARRARPFDVSLHHDVDGIRISAKHDGYRRLRGKIIHSRHWYARESQLLIDDSLDGNYQSAVAHWHFHPALRIRQVADGHFSLVLPQGEGIELYVEGGMALLKDSTWHPGFGLSLPNKKLEITFLGPRLLTRIEWRIA